MKTFDGVDLIYKHLHGKKDKNETLFVFIHGYGSSPLDLLPLAEEMHNETCDCVLLLLKGHGGSGKKLIGIRYQDWIAQISDFIEAYKNSYKHIYIIGFSIGGRLAIDIANLNKCITGIVGISTFISPPKYTDSFLKILLNIYKIFKLKTIPRIVQVTSRNSLKEIYYTRSLPTVETKSLINTCKSIQNNFIGFPCKTLLLHSLNDNVADYAPISKLKIYDKKFQLITLRCLNHFIQFDIPSKNLSDVILEFFFGKKEETVNNSDLIKDSFSHVSDELIHWSGILYKLIVGFFTIFGALVYFSLPDILKNKSTAPYYLLSYSVINSIFMILSSLYFFYTNRVNVYIKNYIEPYLATIPWVSYRTNKFIGGNESSSITLYVSLPLICVPFLIAFGSIIRFMLKDSYLYIESPYKYAFLIILFIFSVILLITAIIVNHKMLKYTKRELYFIKPQKFHSIAMLTKVMQLYESVNPGCVRQKHEKS